MVMDITAMAIHGGITTIIIKMQNGLFLGLDEFKKLPSKDQRSVLYENQVKTLSVVMPIRFHQKLQYGAIGALTAAVTFLFRNAISNG